MFTDSLDVLVGGLMAMQFNLVVSTRQAAVRLCPIAAYARSLATVLKSRGA